MSEPTLPRRGSVIALAGFWLLFELLAFLLYVDAWPDYFLLYDVQESVLETLAWGARLLAAVAISGYERRYNKNVLARVTVILLGAWALPSSTVMSAKPLVMMIGNELVRVR